MIPGRLVDRIQLGAAVFLEHVYVFVGKIHSLPVQRIEMELRDGILINGSPCAHLRLFA